MMTAAKPGVMSGSGSGSGAAAFHATAVATIVRKTVRRREELHFRGIARRSPTKVTSWRAPPGGAPQTGGQSRAPPRSGEV